MHSLLEEMWELDLIHIAYWEVNLRAVRLQFQRQDGEFEERIGNSFIHSFIHSFIQSSSSSLLSFIHIIILHFNYYYHHHYYYNLSSSPSSSSTIILIMHLLDATTNHKTSQKTSLKGTE